MGKIKRCWYMKMRCAVSSSNSQEQDVQGEREAGAASLWAGHSPNGERYLWHASLGCWLPHAYTVHTQRPTGWRELVLWQELVLRRCLGHHVVGMPTHHVRRLRHSGGRNGHLKDKKHYSEFRGRGPESSRWTRRERNLQILPPSQEEKHHLLKLLGSQALWVFSHARSLTSQLQTVLWIESTACYNLNSKYASYEFSKYLESRLRRVSSRS